MALCTWAEAVDAGLSREVTQADADAAIAAAGTVIHRYTGRLFEQRVEQRIVHVDGSGYARVLDPVASITECLALSRTQGAAVAVWDGAGLVGGGVYEVDPDTIETHGSLLYFPTVRGQQVAITGTWGPTAAPPVEVSRAAARLAALWQAGEFVPGADAEGNPIDEPPQPSGDDLRTPAPPMTEQRVASTGDRTVDALLSPHQVGVRVS